MKTTKLEKKIYKIAKTVPRNIYGLFIFAVSVGLFRMAPQWWHLLFIVPIVLGSKWWWEK